MSVTYAGVSTNADLPFLFTLTNRSQNPLDYSVQLEVQTNGRWAGPDFSEGTEDRALPGHGVRTFDFETDTTNHWRMVVFYRDITKRPFASQARVKLAKFAWKQNWRRIYNWLYPLPKFKIAYGPEMFDEKPLLPAQQ